MKIETVLIEAYSSDLKEKGRLVVPDNIDKIDEHACWNLEDLIEVEAPHVTEVGKMAFSGCKKLTKFSAPNLKWIWSKAFSSCENLQEITIGSECIEMLIPAFSSCFINSFDDVFTGCTKLRTIELVGELPKGYNKEGVDKFFAERNIDVQYLEKKPEENGDSGEAGM